MLGMVSYSRRRKSGQITCYLNRTYHVLLTHTLNRFDHVFLRCYRQTDTPDALQAAVHSGRAAGAPDRCLAAVAGPWIGNHAWRRGVPSAPPIAPGRNAQPRVGVPGEIAEGTRQDSARSLRVVRPSAQR